MLQRGDYAQTAGSALPVCQRHFVRDAGVLLPMHSPKSLCGKRHIKDPILTQVRSVLIYDDVSKGLILPFKHGDRLSLTPLLVQLLRPLFDAMASDGMIIMPVPLHKARYFSRRYNQSAELARNLSASSRHNVHFTPNILLRHRNTRSMGGLTSKKRLQNVSGAFLLKHDSLDALNGKNILLIDDILTTGATMESCARLLMTRGKAASVSALVLLRVM
jgi:ComF family protein